MTGGTRFPRVLGVIPAKGRSRRTPGKNMAELAGIPLFAHSVRAAVAAGIPRVIVSSDSEDVLAAAEHWGASPWRRPPHLCTDEATNFDVLVWLHQTLRADGEEFDCIALLQPTTPFRTSASLEEMLARFENDPAADSLVTVTPATRPTGTIEDGRWHCPLAGQTRLKQATPTYAFTGHLVLLRPERTLQKGSLLGEAILPALLPETWLDIDIDMPNDLLVAQAVAPTFFASPHP